MSDIVTGSLNVNKAKGSFRRDEQIFRYPARLGNPGTTATVGYIKTGINTGMLTLAQSATADTWVIHLSGLHEGDIITGMGIHGQIDSGGNAVTVDYELREQTAVVTGCTDASVQAGTQIAKSADYLIDEHTDVATPHTVTEGKLLYLLVTCTTAATTDIELLYLDLEVKQQ